jgi:multidrug resistance efflux pump
VAQIHQIHLRHIEIGQAVEVAMKTVPGTLILGTVEGLVPAISGGQAQVSCTIAASAINVSPEPFLVRITIDDSDAYPLQPGAVGLAAIYTDNSSATHMIRKVMMRMTAITNYLIPNI